MQWDQESKSNQVGADTPTGKPQNKRKLLNYWDSGLGKESSSSCDTELSFYDQQEPTTEHDANTKDSGCDDEESYTLELRENPWLNEESMDFTNLDINTNAELPTDFETLISGSFVNKNLPGTSEFKRSLSVDEKKLKKVPFNRIESAIEFRSSKRSRVADDPSSPCLQRSLSYDEENIKCALQRSSVEPDLIGDFSKPCNLPLTLGRHRDLKCVTTVTVAALLKGEYDTSVTSYKIIDCRFPYEFNGGHINGAVNLFKKEQIINMLDQCEHLGHVLIFHCEFSSERGPTLYRFLRKLDRNRNEYPKLNYPEMYVLEGGYKKFYEQYSDLCVPKAYMPMLDPEHQEEMRLFKSQSKSFNEDRLRPNNKGSFKRLGFL